MNVFEIIVKVLTMAETLSPVVVGAVNAFKKAHASGTTIEQLLDESDARALSILDRARAEIANTPTI